METNKRMKLTEELMNKMHDINKTMDQSKNDNQTVFHILTGMADTFVLVLESISLSKVIEQEREQVRAQMAKCLQQMTQGSELTTAATPQQVQSRNSVQKSGTRLIRTASSHYRIHNKKVPNQAKARTMFLENATPQKFVNKTQDGSNVGDQMATALIPATVLYKGDVYEISSLVAFRNKLVNSLESTNFPWKDLVKRSIKAIEVFRKKQPKSDIKKAINIGGKPFYKLKTQTFHNNFIFRNPSWSN